MFQTKKIYLDYSATTPVDPRVLESMLPYFTDKFGNASSTTHAYGWDAEEAVELAREQVANLIGSKPKEIHFTSGATEAINLALFGIVKSNPVKDQIITCVTEHKAVLETCRELEHQGKQVMYLKVDEHGSIDLDELKNAITNRTILIVLMTANNETGTIHPIREVTTIAQERGVLVMTDATQAVGKIPVNVAETGVDFAVFSAHKLYGPKGVGALYIRKDSKSEIAPTLFGGGQERSIRPGTLNVPGIVGFGKACELSALEMEQDARRLHHLRDQIEHALAGSCELRINGIKSPRLPHITNLSIENIDGSRLIRSLTNLAVSQGSACTSVIQEPSHVLKGMGHTDELALSSLRISLGRPTTEEEVNAAIRDLAETIEGLKLTSYERG